ncbi:MAG: hypothetical protein LBS53_00920 [Synergistaceae bacterium]|jgi:hypothetical protein|nr:hypothetical protein [Synergistaceae bacterium]
MEIKKLEIKDLEKVVEIYKNVIENMVVKAHHRIAFIVDTLLEPRHTTERNYVMSLFFFRDFGDFSLNQIGGCGR